MDFPVIANSTLYCLFDLHRKDYFKGVRFSKVLLALGIGLILYPFFLAEKIVFRRKISRHKISEDPIFIIGHWRSGTTHLHNLICQNPQFGFVDNSMAFMPEGFLILGKIFKKVINTILPEKRPMDEVIIRAESPQEEEFALAAKSSQSFYHVFSFPSKREELFDQYLLFKNISKSEMKNWENTYEEFIRKVSFFHKGKRLVLKNPANTFRIRILLELFPESKFIYLKRNKEEVVHSVIKSMKILTEMNSLEKTIYKPDKERISGIYDKLIKEYGEQKGYIPKGNLTEINYEDLISDPVSVISNIYRELQLDGHLLAEKLVAQYMQKELRRENQNKHLKRKVA